jgi:putative tryptophan/tyrosine transport system substrate-binding protein
MTILRVTRRIFVAALGGASAWPLVARGQQLAKVWRVGYLSPAGGESGEALFNVFSRKMQDLGYVLGKNLHVDRRSAEGDYSRLPALAVETVSLAPDVIVGANSAATAALQRATSSIPIVMGTTGDPIGDGFIKSFAKPGGNITGMSSQSAELTARRSNSSTLRFPMSSGLPFLLRPRPNTNSC